MAPKASDPGVALEVHEIAPLCTPLCTPLGAEEEKDLGGIRFICKTGINDIFQHFLGGGGHQYQAFRGGRHESSRAGKGDLTPPLPPPMAVEYMPSCKSFLNRKPEINGPVHKLTNVF